MRPEYIKIDSTEKVYGQKNLLKSQLELISVIKALENYKKQRNEELILKISLKNRLSELKSALEVLDKILPKPTITPAKETIIKFDEPRKKLSLEQEAEEIKRKLLMLQNKF